MAYFDIIKKTLPYFSPEFAHQAGVLAIGKNLLPAQPVIQDERLKVELCGLSLPNPIGLAAGFDKNARTLPHIFKQGFGFVECGTVTPRPQEGNPKPRVFRVPEQEAVINRLGFNNDGVALYVPRLRKHNGAGIVGANIGKNKDSEDAVADYVMAARAVYPYAHYLTINISSPNTAGLRDLQQSDALGGLIKAVHDVRAEKVAEGLSQKPIFVKIAPDLDAAQQEAIAELALSLKVDALIVSNTTTARPGMAEVPDYLIHGGMSGKPLMDASTQILKNMARLTKQHIPLIGVGGIASAEDAYEKIKAGASAVQLYSALVYQGFDLVTTINKGLISLLEKDGLASLKDAKGASL